MKQLHIPRMHLQRLPVYSDVYKRQKEYTIPQKTALPVALFADDCIVNTYTLYSLKHSSIDYEIVFTSTMSENIEEAVRSGLAAVSYTHLERPRSVTVRNPCMERALPRHREL